MLAGMLKVSHPAGLSGACTKQSRATTLRRRAQCLTAATINTFSLAEECSN
jgi:hypothetical protein